MGKNISKFVFYYSCLFTHQGNLKTKFCIRIIYSSLAKRNKLHKIQYKLFERLWLIVIGTFSWSKHVKCIFLIFNHRKNLLCPLDFRYCQVVLYIGRGNSAQTVWTGFVKYRVYIYVFWWLLIFSMTIKSGKPLYFWKTFEMKSMIFWFWSPFC